MPAVPTDRSPRSRSTTVSDQAAATAARPLSATGQSQSRFKFDGASILDQENGATEVRMRLPAHRRKGNGPEVSLGSRTNAIIGYRSRPHRVTPCDRQGEERCS